MVSANYFCEYTWKTISLKFHFFWVAQLIFIDFLVSERYKTQTIAWLFWFCWNYFYWQCHCIHCGSVFIVCYQNKVLINVSLCYPVIVIAKSHSKYIILFKSKKFIFHKLMTNMEEQRSFIKVLEWSFISEFPTAFLINNLWLIEKSLYYHLHLFLVFFHLFSPTKITTEFWGNFFPDNKNKT